MADLANNSKSKHWRFHYRQNSNSRRGVSPPKAAIATPPLIISSSTKSKLKAFEFAGSRPMEGIMEKENIQPNNGLEACITAFNSKPSGENTYDQSRAVLEQLRESPRTPAGRLALADLLGETNTDGDRSMIPTGSPDERVLWEHSRSPYSSGQPSSLLPITKRGKKRARSSSPASSPHLKTPKAKTSKEVFDLQHLNSSLKTPAAKAAESRQPMPLAFAHLFETTSPRPAADPSYQTKSAALNRSLSCGTEWPTSKAKRRKTDQSSELLKGQASKSKADVGRVEGATKLSRVSLLMEKVQDSLKTPSKVDSHPAPSSSSPLPDRSDAAMEVNGSPLQAQQMKQRKSIGAALPDLSQQSTSQQEPGSSSNQVIPSSSEYGDLRDDDLLEIKADSTGSTGSVASEEVPIQAENGVSDKNVHVNLTAREEEAYNVLAPSPGRTAGSDNKIPISMAIYEDDEFPSDDLEELMVQYDNQSGEEKRQLQTGAPSPNVSENTRAPQTISSSAKGQSQLPESSSNEYGLFVSESDDDLDFLAAEAQATAETGSAQKGRNNVC